MVVAYDGTAYHGWQVQPEVPTVAGVLEKRFQDVFKKHIKLIGASRTDAGVHALGQVASFALDHTIAPETMLFAWNNVLPPDILIRSLDVVCDTYHPQRQVIQKTYYYHFFEQRPLPFLGRYGFFCGKFDTAKVYEGLQIFVGTHDYRSFCTGDEAESTIRTIDSIDLVYYRRFGVYRIAVKGPGFLRHMIRRIVGACLDVASSNKRIDELVKALDSKDPHQHLYVAPPHGLILHGIQYSSL